MKPFRVLPLSFSAIRAAAIALLIACPPGSFIRSDAARIDAARIDAAPQQKPSPVKAPFATQRKAIVSAASRLTSAERRRRQQRKNQAEADRLTFGRKPTGLLTVYTSDPRSDVARTRGRRLLPVVVEMPTQKRVLTGSLAPRRLSGSSDAAGSLRTRSRLAGQKTP